MASAGNDNGEIQEETGARVTFSDRDEKHREGDEDRTVFIRGDSESAQRAEVMIRQVIADMPTIITEEVQVPVYCLGRLIGRGGETIRGMSRTSRCRIFIDRSQDSQGPEVPRIITITGTQSDIEIAKNMIEEKVNEEEEFRTKMAAKGANREQRKKPAEEGKERVPLTSRVVKTEGPWDAGDQTVRNGAGAIVPSAEPVREFMQVFVTAVEHASHFWVQMMNKEALNLDKLTQDMSVFYSDHNKSIKYKVSEVKEGDMVAAPFAMDSMWYRARVEGIEDGNADLYYIDFGDNGLVPLTSLRELKPEFLILPVQAIECKLANVQPAGEKWTEESTDLFESLTDCANWKILSARTAGYVSVDSTQRPCLQLVDNSTEPPTDIATEMVNRGMAVWETPDSPPPSFPPKEEVPRSPPSPSSEVPKSSEQPVSTEERVPL